MVTPDYSIRHRAEKFHVHFFAFKSDLIFYGEEQEASEAVH